MRTERLQVRWKNVSLTRNEYEQAYADALECLKQLGHQIGNPYRAHDGVRLVRVDRFSWADDAVFEEAWGKDRAAAIAAAQTACSEPAPVLR
jgi:hypothetical protein